jgi:hypothetical protein
VYEYEYQLTRLGALRQMVKVYRLIFTVLVERESDKVPKDVRHVVTL